MKHFVNTQEKINKKFAYLDVNYWLLMSVTKDIKMSKLVHLFNNMQQQRFISCDNRLQESKGNCSQERCALKEQETR